jgi:predicted nucleic acid-binding protein
LDLLIAATAHAQGAKLITANAAVFQHLYEVIEVVAI